MRKCYPVYKITFTTAGVPEVGRNLE